MASEWEWEVQGNYGYGHGWDVVTTEASEVEAKSAKRTYDLEEPQYPHRIKRVRATKE
ncbi:hypothetical protein ACFWPU_00975 [Streptomyces sp. NPDC058471]|uniref:hypothetical protein n=1 Tax=Streptomyces sp. NPDC058471 TaxID=3346516 RepID=UPI00364F32FD